MECANAQDQLHRDDPEAFPRSGENGYCLDFEDQIFLAKSFETDDSVRIVYHSHPNGSTGFSAADRAGAMSDGKPLYESLSYLVIGCTAVGATGAALYSFDDDEYRKVWEWSPAAI